MTLKWIRFQIESEDHAMSTNIQLLVITLHILHAYSIDQKEIRNSHISNLLNDKLQSSLWNILQDICILLCILIPSSKDQKLIVSHRNASNVTPRNRQGCLTLYPFIANRFKVQNLNGIRQKGLVISVSRQPAKANQISIIQDTQWSRCLGLGHLGQRIPFVVLNRVHFAFVSQFAVYVASGYDYWPLPTGIEKASEWCPSIWHWSELMSFDLIALDFKQNIIRDSFFWLCILGPSYDVDLVAFEVVGDFGHE